MSIKENILKINKELPPAVKLVAVSKFKPSSDVMEAYGAWQRIFGESRPQELKAKAESLPKDIQWHFIGHLQSNKIKMVVPFVSLIHSVDTAKLLFEINDYCLRNDIPSVDVLLEMHIAMEETKQGFSLEEVLEVLDGIEAASAAGCEKNGCRPLSCVKIRGLMAMASFTDNTSKIRAEFSNLLSIKSTIDNRHYSFLKNFDQLSFGMTHDYRIAVEMGATLVRIGTAIFGVR